MGLDIKPLLSYYIIVVFQRGVTSFNYKARRRAMSECSTVSAVIPKLSREVVDIFIEPVIKRFDTSFGVSDEDAREKTEDNSK
jgi:hypothetical protein